MIKLFIQNAASFDFAFLARNSEPIGKSFYLDVTFEGNINSNGMVMDFSHAKKMIKSILKGFDHRLLVCKQDVMHKTRTHIIVSSRGLKDTLPREQEPHFFAMHANLTWVKIVRSQILKSLEENCTSEFESLIAKQISDHVPKNVTKISVKLKEKIGTQDPKEAIHEAITNLPLDFQYTHSLCYHDGHCQRFHGHSAQVRVMKNKVLDVDLSAFASKKLNGFYIISERHLYPLFNSSNFNKIKKYCFKKNQFEKIKHNLHAFEYKASFGKVSVVIAKHLTLLLPNESTIENITQYIRNRIPHNHGIEVCVYEGLSKGAIVE